ncbi:hypothetical protein BIW11_09766 [Tropilaelaps mercedesae]|uniref:Uncharacterized protein n=1 Tax=Tropilaelaps mercedesae TaxID=418985 RepID=A0A1V9XIP1_9ACAR|nr:hypothetical protein BIW11_09766 [Tropilaelaps mercedesae]
MSIVKATASPLSPQRPSLRANTCHHRTPAQKCPVQSSTQRENSGPALHYHKLHQEANRYTRGERNDASGQSSFRVSQYHALDYETTGTYVAELVEQVVSRQGLLTASVPPAVITNDLTCPFGIDNSSTRQNTLTDNGTVECLSVFGPMKAKIAMRVRHSISLFDGCVMAVAETRPSHLPADALVFKTAVTLARARRRLALVAGERGAVPKKREQILPVFYLQMRIDHQVLPCTVSTTSATPAPIPTSLEIRTRDFWPAGPNLRSALKH